MQGTNKNESIARDYNNIDKLTYITNKNTAITITMYSDGNTNNARILRSIHRFKTVVENFSHLQILIIIDGSITNFHLQSIKSLATSNTQMLKLSKIWVFHMQKYGY